MPYESGFIASNERDLSHMRKKFVHLAADERAGAAGSLRIAMCQGRKIKKVDGGEHAGITPSYEAKKERRPRVGDKRGGGKSKGELNSCSALKSVGSNQPREGEGDH